MKKHKTLSFIIPFFKAKKYIEQNLENWKQISKLVQLIFIEDDEKKPSEKYLKKAFNNNIIYHSKKNGNWGSVINYSRKKQLINTEWVAIVDPDDTINIKDLKKLIKYIENTKNDLVFTDHKRIFLRSKKEKIISFKNWDKKRILPFVHSAWFRKELFYSSKDLPINMYFTDSMLMTEIVNNSKSQGYLEICPYNYFKQLNGQSMEGIKFDCCRMWIEHLKFSGDYLKYSETSKLCMLFGIEQLIRYTNVKSVLKSAKKRYKSIYKSSQLALFWNKLFFISMLRLFSIKTRHKLSKEF